jgi:hypothetical protein
LAKDEAIAALAKSPLLFDPGTDWEYGFSTDVLGFVVEAVTGRTLGEFLGERLWGPLGMADTGFALPAAKRARYALALAKDPVTGSPNTAIHHGTDRTQIWESGGGGTVSTAGDYLRFAEMMRQGGKLGGAHIRGRGPGKWVPKWLRRGGWSRPGACSRSRIYLLRHVALADGVGEFLLCRRIEAIVGEPFLGPHLTHADALDVALPHPGEERLLAQGSDRRFGGAVTDRLVKLLGLAGRRPVGFARIGRGQADHLRRRRRRWRWSCRRRRRRSRWRRRRGGRIRSATAVACSSGKRGCREGDKQRGSGPHELALPWPRWT